MNEKEIEILEKQGCVAEDWSHVSIAEGADLSRIRNVYFSGPVSIGANPEIINVPGGIRNVHIGDNVRIINTSRIENSKDAKFGVGTDIAVLDETGKRPVRIYPGISAQIATMAARLPNYTEGKLMPLIDRHILDLPEMLEIGDGAEILDCGPLTDVRIWPGVKVEGALRLHNGSVISNEGLGVKGLRVKDDGGKGLAYVGPGVDAENFIIEDATVTGGCVLRNTYVGQGCVLDKGFTSHDSLFFANCSMENGEACAVLAGPYTVSMHKSSLLIGCHTGFMNAGSGTNMSNHMYKTGPEHWGVLERGVKTSSNSYLMHGSRIGAYSLVMGEHKNHPDSSDFPFSYLFGDANGYTTVVPGAMLKSYGLKRDEEKWPKRDRRAGHVTRMNDRITYSILNPYTVNMILDAIDTIDKLISLPPDQDGFIGYKGLKIKKKSLEKGKQLYELALLKYVESLKEQGLTDEEMTAGTLSRRWVDLSGQILAESNFNAVLNAESIQDMEAALDKAEADYSVNERIWMKDRLKDCIDMDTLSALKGPDLDALVEKDRNSSLAQIALENDMLRFI